MNQILGFLMISITAIIFIRFAMISLTQDDVESPDEYNQAKWMQETTGCQQPEKNSMKMDISNGINLSS